MADHTRRKYRLRYHRAEDRPSFSSFSCNVFRYLLCAVVVVSTAFPTVDTGAQPPETELTAPEAVNVLTMPADGTGKIFGRSLALSRTKQDVFLVAGAPVGIGGGACVYVFRKAELGWDQEAVLLPPSGTSHTYFGWELAASGEWCFVARLGRAVHIYRRNPDHTWTHTQSLDPQGATDFGRSVSVRGDVAAVGAGKTSAYVYRLRGTEWEQSATLEPETSSPYSFGTQVAVGKDLIVVGIPRAFTDGEFTGEAHVYRYANDEWVHTARLHPDHPVEGAVFGASLAVASLGTPRLSNVVLVGAPGYIVDSENPQVNRGAAFAFSELRGWDHEVMLCPDDTDDHDSFGSEVAIDNGLAVIGARRQGDNPRYDTGAAYVYRWKHQEWVLKTRLTAPHPQNHAEFSIALDVSGNVTAISDRMKRPGNTTMESPNKKQRGKAEVKMRGSIYTWFDETWE